MLEVQNLKKVYGNEIKYEALKGINLTVQDGEFIGIMGPSGSGKSSPTDGEILLNGKNPNNLNQEQIAKFRRTELGFVFQSFNLMPTLTVEENIILPLTLDGEKVSVMKRQLAELSERLGINHLLKKRIAEISGGQAQRVAVARAMIHHPQLLLADEPTGNLDTKSSKDVMGLLQQLNEEEAATILMVTHDPLAASYCKRIVFIKDGELIDEIIQNGNQKEFYDLIMVKLAEIEGVDNEF
ncbi:ABC transporter ATP-binding protein [Enterococcus faecalis]|uniref:ABC transporter ATP-binding protein n=1 Tax=Enterococcus faecalis TaxID=1351 RepID=UPI00325AB4CA